MSNKIKLENLTEKNILAAQNIVRHVVSFQTEPTNYKLAYPIIAAILKGDGSNGLYNGLYNGLHEGLDKGLYEGLSYGLYVELKRGLHNALDDGLNDGLDGGLNIALHRGLRRALHDGLQNGLDEQLDQWLHDALYDGLKNALNDGLNKELNDEHVKYLYCGVFWSWWLCRYLIAAQWGCELDMQKLALLYAFCRYCPVWGKIEKDGKEYPVPLPKPTKVGLIEVGLTPGSIPLPVFELHGNGESAVEHPCLKEPLYYFHNTPIPAYMGSVHSTAWQPEWIVSEQNSEIRTILLEEIGIDKVSHMGVEKDSYTKYDNEWFTKSEYQLLDMSQLFESIDYAPYLKMKNQTTGAIHLEAVSDDCKTITDALSFRCGVDFNNIEIGSIQ